MKKLFLYVFLVLIFSLYKSSAFADYIVTGKITGMECGMFGIKCKIVNVDAVKKDGQLYQLRGRYEKVSEYNKSKKRCWINQGFFSDDYYEKQEDGTYKKVDLEYFTFPCIKQ